MPRFLRLIIWDALFFLILSVGYAAGQYLGETTSSSYLVTLLTCAICGAFLAQLSLWGIGWSELLLVGLPALYLAFAPYLSTLLGGLSAIPFSLVPEALLLQSAASLRMAGALTFGFLVWEKFR